MGFDPLDSEHSRRLRAERMLSFLRDVWGEEMPPSPHPEVTVLVDAVAIDDVLGGEDGLVVQGDGLSYAVLAELVRRARDVRPEALLAPRLLARLGLRRHTPVAADLRDLAEGRTSLTLTAGAGAWDLEEQTRTLTWDSCFARLTGVGGQGGSAPWDEVLESVVHPADKEDIRHSLEATLTGNSPYEVRFRARTADGGWSWLQASGRRIDPPVGPGKRLIGMVTA